MALFDSVVITGASGLLGRSLMTKFRESGMFNKVIGTAFSRADGTDILKLDLTDLDGTKAFIEKTKPQVLVHAAAQRFPDKVEKEFDAARNLNVEVTRVIAEAMNAVDGWMMYISTDYVFDGSSPPYGEDDQTSPINTYGELKLDGETRTLSTNPNHLVLRIPILYGPVEYLAESAVTVLFEKLKKQQSENAETNLEVSDYEIRRPAHVDDIAAICCQLVAAKHKAPENVCGVYQWSGCEPLTKYKMIQIMAAAFGMNSGRIVPTGKPPADTGTPKRPYDTTMTSKRLEQLGIQHHTPFQKGIEAVLSPWK